MSQVINTNVLSLNAQRNLNQTQGDLAQSLERLSSGLRINSAKDDAAGLAISERFTTQINGLNQAVRNSNDGISFAQTAEGALDTIGDALQRARQLAVQSANDTNSASDRQAINDEVQQLMEEVSRVANSAEFNGGRILDGTVEDLFFQVGANQGQTIAVDGVDARTSELGTTEVVGSGGLTQEQIAQIDEVDGFSGPFEDITISSNDFDDIQVQLSGDDAPGEEVEPAATLEDAVRMINAAITEAASAGDENAKDVADADLEAALRVKNDGTTTIAITSRLGTENLDVTDGNVDVDEAPVALFDNDGGADVTLNDVDVVTRETATQSIGAFDGALTKVNSLRAELGAVQTRFESTIANLEIGSENLSDARSRIRDADFAAETAELSRAQVLQQAGTTVLSQANAVPQNVLGLLQ
ncbi:flagellin [Thioalkalivibrio halophilus]|uniref:Flagellin n=1 Tax=Thioalkalivibrio halophilus TaxID=252474 RepID=A0A1V2ZW74_9GAMM|nr:flagellin [Thioalkalivibrio halophilus]OOC09241.1 flagellin [Thioalkalivibrio halophilus]